LRKTIGFIGTGVMGASMAAHLIEAGYSLSVYNRTKEKADSLIKKGAVWRGTPGDAAAACGVIITIVGYPHDVESVYLGDGGIIERAEPGSLLIDMTTSSPALARKIYDAAKNRGLGALDSPVTGGDRGAREASLSIMVGGDEADFERALPILKVMGRNIVRFGDAGSGQTAKLANQIVIAGTMLGVCEGLAFASKMGLDRNELLGCITNGSAGSWSLASYGPRILKGDFAPGFFVKHFIKDMKLAKDASEEAGMSLEGLEAALCQYEKLASEGGENDGTQGLYKLYD
jgi:3-hydroxyisobutyrate dehydrogenase